MTTQSPPERVSAKPTPAVTTVMVVDDSVMVRKQVVSVLTAAGYAVIEAEDGAEALEKLESGPAPSLIVLDMNMPKVGGIEVLERMQERKQTDVPVVMMTTVGQPSIMQAARALGARGWIVKPFREELLLAAVRKLVVHG